MLGFIVSSILGGQLLSRTGRYKILAIIGFAVAAFGMFLLSRMTPTTTEGEIVRNMIVTGLGIGVMMSLFTIVVQNAFPYRQLGEVTATLTFFRSIGSTIGVAVMGSIMTNDFQTTLQSNLPPALTRLIHASGQSQLNPQALLDQSTFVQLQHSFAGFGAQGLVLFHQFIEAIKVSLSSAITEVFFLGFIIMLLGLFACLFLREIPLRKAHNAPVAQAPTSDTNNSRALLGLTLALMAREAQKPDADPHVLATLSNAVNGRYPYTWSDEERARAVAQDIIEPLSISLLASSLGSGGGQNNDIQAAQVVPSEASDALAGGFLE